MALWAGTRREWTTRLLRAEDRVPVFQQAFKNIDDVLWKDAGCTSELDYTEQTSWLLFLKYLDALEHDKATEAALDGKKYTHILDAPYRWESWALGPRWTCPAACLSCSGRNRRHGASRAFYTEG